MARYRKGDRYLSEDEYREESDSNWAFGLFLIGAIASGYFANKGLDTSDIPKWLKFGAVILSGLVGGGILGALHKQVQFLIGLLVIGGILFVIASWVWSTL